MAADTDRFDQCYTAVLAWADTLHQQGWLHDAEIKALQQMETAQADELFEATSQRPLLVAFFGGTGVGKSSLLNRLAGESIAQVGVVRPTSHHVTLYLHESYRGSLHEQALPTEQTQIVYHADAAKKYFAWLDMPDIDSTEQSNRAVVESWLPVIDWLIYVVTPDRYHDDLGWQFVQARGHQHAWMFVMNHWDEGEPEQWEDFRKRLVEQGFTDPVVLRTSCASDLSDDDFRELEARLQQALQEHGIDNLRHAAQARRWQALQKQITALYQQLEQRQAWRAVGEEWQNLVDDHGERLNTLLISNTELAYQQWRLAEQAGKHQPPALQLTSSPHDEAGNILKLNQVYDGRCDAHLKTLSLAIDNLFSAKGLPVQPVQARSQQLVTDGREIYLQEIDAALVRSLKKPGNVLSRFFRRLLLFFQWVLPLSAALWAGYHIVSGFYNSTQGTEDFLGINFAVHSLLMIGLAWSIPWFILKQTQPSYAKSARTGIQQGIQVAGKQFRELLEQKWHELEAAKTRRLDQLSKIQENCGGELQQQTDVLKEYMS